MEKIVPIHNAIITTANRYTKEDIDKTESGLILLDKQEGVIKLRQTILALGGTASRELKVGDVIEINPKNYIRREQKKKAFQPDLSKEEYGWEYYLDLPIEKSEDQEILFLYDSDVRYKVVTEEA